MTICVVALLGGRSKEEWYKWVKDRVEKQVGWETPEDIAPVFNERGGPGAGGMSIGRVGGMGSASVLSALAGPLGRGEDEDEEDGDEGGNGSGPRTLRLSENLAGA